MALKPYALTTSEAVLEALPSGVTTSRAERLINAVSMRFQRHLSRDLGLTIVDPSSPEIHQGTGNYHLFLRHAPIVSVTQVRIMQQVVNDWQRDPLWDKWGAIYRRFGWYMYAPTFGDLTNDVNLNPDGRWYNIDVAYTGGWVLPQYDGAYRLSKSLPASDPANNPTGGPSNLPEDIEEACIRECNRIIMRPVAGIKDEATPGGWRIRWDDQEYQMGFDKETVATLDHYAFPARHFL